MEETIIRMTADVSVETKVDRKQWNSIFEVLGGGGKLSTKMFISNENILQK